MKTTIVILILLVGILLNVVYLQNEEIKVCDKIHYMDSLTIERYRQNQYKQDSIINFLSEIKITEITIIEKDTVK